MKKTFKIAVFEGDGIGPEIMAPTIDLLASVSKNSSSYSFEFESFPAGAVHYAKYGQSLPKASVEGARNADAILLSAMGMPDIRYQDGTEISPQIELRKEFNLYAGVRPVTVAPGQKSPLTIPEGHTIDFVLVRESTEGLFWSQGRGEVSDDEARETLRITRETSQKLFRFAFELARQRRDFGRGEGRVTCVDKANVFRAFAYFRSLFDAEASDYDDVTADHAYVDAAAMWMIQKPWTFDVLVTENMFGDILSDLGAGIMGGLGLAPSADIGDDQAVFQPCHGSAPDIAQQGIANPSAMILSAVMMLDWLGIRHEIPEMVQDGERVRKAVIDTIIEGAAVTRDLGGRATTAECAGAILGRLQ